MDNIRMKVLADGTIQVTTDKISQPNHMNAEAFLKGLDEILGGGTTVVNRKGHTHHHHDHDHTHDHDHEVL